MKKSPDQATAWAGAILLALTIFGGVVIGLLMVEEPDPPWWQTSEDIVQGSAEGSSKR